MREIKFRAYVKGDADGESGWVQGFNMCSFHSYYNKGSEPHIFRYSTIWKLSEIVLEQYTGLKDKNGVEIYEGDILKYDGEKCPHCEKHRYGEHYPYEVKWDNKSSCFECKNFENFMSPELFEEMEVIGNIHNDPELLKSNA